MGEVLMNDEYVSRKEVYNALLDGMCGTGCQSDALSALRMVENADVAPVVHAYYKPEVMHCFNEYYGEIESLSFYSKIICSHCGRPIATIGNVKTIERPDGLDGDWEIDPLEFYDEVGGIVKARMYNRDYQFGNYCPNCGARMDGDGL